MNTTCPTCHEPPVTVAASGVLERCSCPAGHTWDRAASSHGTSPSRALVTEPARTWAPSIPWCSGETVLGPSTDKGSTWFCTATGPTLDARAQKGHGLERRPLTARESVAAEERHPSQKGAVEVRCVFTSPIALRGIPGTTQSDGVRLDPDDLVLVAGQTRSSENGVYRVQFGAWTRAETSPGPVHVGEGALLWGKTVWGGSVSRYFPSEAEMLLTKEAREYVLATLALAKPVEQSAEGFLSDIADLLGAVVAPGFQRLPHPRNDLPNLRTAISTVFVKLGYRTYEQGNRTRAILLHVLGLHEPDCPSWVHPGALVFCPLEERTWTIGAIRGPYVYLDGGKEIPMGVFLRNYTPIEGGGPLCADCAATMGGPCTRHARLIARAAADRVFDRAQFNGGLDRGHLGREVRRSLIAEVLNAADAHEPPRFSSASQPKKIGIEACRAAFAALGVKRGESIPDAVRAALLAAFDLREPPAPAWLKPGVWVFDKLRGTHGTLRKVAAVNERGARLEGAARVDPMGLFLQLFPEPATPPPALLALDAGVTLRGCRPAHVPDAGYSVEAGRVGHVFRVRTASQPLGYTFDSPVEALDCFEALCSCEGIRHEPDPRAAVRVGDTYEIAEGYFFEVSHFACEPDKESFWMVHGVERKPDGRVAPASYNDAFIASEKRVVAGLGSNLFGEAHPFGGLLAALRASYDGFLATNEHLRTAWQRGWGEQEAARATGRHARAYQAAVLRLAAFELGDRDDCDITHLYGTELEAGAAALRHLAARIDAGWSVTRALDDARAELQQVHMPAAARAALGPAPEDVLAEASRVTMFLRDAFEAAAATYLRERARLEGR